MRSNHYYFSECRIYIPIYNFVHATKQQTALSSRDGISVGKSYEIYLRASVVPWKHSHSHCGCTMLRVCVCYFVYIYTHNERTTWLCQTLLDVYWALVKCYTHFTSIVGRVIFFSFLLLSRSLQSIAWLVCASFYCCWCCCCRIRMCKHSARYTVNCFTNDIMMNALKYTSYTI